MASEQREWSLTLRLATNRRQSVAKHTGRIPGDELTGRVRAPELEAAEVFLADAAQDIHLIKLEDDEITCNGANVLAFDAGIDWDIKREKGMGVMAGGLFNMALSGSGWVAVISDGPPVLLETGDTPTYADPAAAITWASSVETSMKTDVNLKTLIGKGSGETVQMAFTGRGWVLIQPSEGRVQAPANGQGGGAGGILGNLTR